MEKESEHETFKIRDENPWVTVEPSGAVRVKKRWDYEELGREKTIDFWVIITNSGAAEWRGLQCKDTFLFIIIIAEIIRLLGIIVVSIFILFFVGNDEK